jgi:sugar/nucleoside kinase (ribokinase family)
MNVFDAAPVVCLSYLADAELWTVPAYPAANTGAVISHIEHSVAADAPMTAAVLAGLGHPALLLANGVGDDGRGRRVTDWLADHDVDAACGTRRGATTPHITVIEDEQNTRTWFLNLAAAATELADVDLAAFSGAHLAYIDAYEVIKDVAAAAIHAAASALTLINLGGAAPGADVLAAIRAHPRAIVQTNVDDDRHLDAPARAAELAEATGAEAAVVTAGAYGAVAVARNGRFEQAPGFVAQVRHTHCAGAAFSGGLLSGLARGLPLEQALLWGCASGALRCELPHDAQMPTARQVQAVIGTRASAPVHQPKTEQSKPLSMLSSATRQ